ncbi:hypothetical protein QAD02_008867, partial [Eretmocerus hayati]
RTLSTSILNKKDIKDKEILGKEGRIKSEPGIVGAGSIVGSGANQSLVTATESCRLCGKSVANIKKHMKSHFPDNGGTSPASSSSASLLGSPYMRLEPKHFLAKTETSFLT